MLTDKLFTGQRDTGLGIYDYGARFYSPKLGRFLNPDNIELGYANPQNLNRMSYVLNNPVRYTDPTGHMLPCEPGDVCQHPDPLPPPPPPPPPRPPRRPVPVPEPPQEPGPIIIVPGEIVLGPIVTLPNFPDPNPAICRAINDQILRVRQQIARLAAELKKLADDINNAQDDLIRKVLMEELKKLEAELLGKINELNRLYKLAKGAGCSGWE